MNHPSVSVAQRVAQGTCAGAGWDYSYRLALELPGMHLCPLAPMQGSGILHDCSPALPVLIPGWVRLFTFPPSAQTTLCYNQGCTGYY